MNLNLDLTPAFFANISFLLLFLAMTFYWIDLAFFEKKKVNSSNKYTLKNTIGTQSNISSVSSSAFSSTTSFDQINGTFFTSKSLNFEKIAQLTLVSSNLSLVLLLCVRWIESGHFPLSNLYESLMFLSWSCTTIHLSLIYTTANNNLFMQKLLGSVLAPCALFLNAFATFSLPKEMQQAGPLVPALQSNWLMMHVTVMIVSYAALILGSLLAIAYLIYGFANSLFQQDIVEKNHSKLATNLDYLSYRIIGIGFPFLTIGILSGAVWANEAWGSYWSWDPKETWALLTWLVFAIYLHTRFTKGWEGFKPSLIASFGFIVVWVCYLGVNLLGEGLHSYGFLS